MELIRIERFDPIAVLELNRGVTNALNLQLLQELAEAIRLVRESAEIRSLVLTSANDKFFSIGLDIPHLLDLGQEDAASFYWAFNQVCLGLFTLPKPTVAAITGHAIAGGCILALCCDFRLIAEGRRLMGLNEVKLGLPVPYLADCLLRQIAGARQARDMMETGEFYRPEELLRLGIVDQVLPLDEVRTEAMKKGRALGALPAHAFGVIKRSRVEIVEAQVLAHPEKDQVFVECWCTEEAQALLREAAGKF